MMTRLPIHHPAQHPATTLRPATIPGHPTGAVPTEEVAR